MPLAYGCVLNCVNHMLITWTQVRALNIGFIVLISLVGEEVLACVHQDILKDIGSSTYTKSKKMASTHHTSWNHFVLDPHCTQQVVPCPSRPGPSKMLFTPTAPTLSSTMNFYPNFHSPLVSTQIAPPQLDQTIPEQVHAGSGIGK
jgi:hypothetical protein